MDLRQMYDDHRAMYGRRNRIRFRGIGTRIAFLLDAARDLETALRKNPGDTDGHGIVCARIISRAFCVADYYGPDLPLLERLELKFLAGCRYCDSLPCVCAKVRPEPVFGKRPLREKPWRMNEVAAQLDATYGEKNRAHGLSYVVNRLMGEIAEVSTLAADLPLLARPNDELEAMMADEINDCQVWTIGGCTLIGADLEVSWKRLYADGCPKCRRSPCECGPFTVPSAAWASSLPYQSHA